MQFVNRQGAGRQLARAALKFKKYNPLVLGLPLGGVVVAKEVADSLEAPLDVIVVRKISVPDYPEFALGALAEDGVPFVNESAVEQLAIDNFIFGELTQKQQTEINKLVSLFRSNRQPLSLANRCVIVVDEGLSTGAISRAAIEYAKRQGASKVILAVPVGAAETVLQQQKIADEVICLHQPSPFVSVSSWYDDFAEVEDDKIVSALNHSRSDEAAWNHPHLIGVNRFSERKLNRGQMNWR